MEMEDSEIIELYFSRSESAVSATEKKYGRLCLSIARNILGVTEDSEECVNDTLLAVWNAVPPARPTSLKAFVIKIIRNTALNRLSYNTAQKRSAALVPLDELSEILPDKSIREGASDDDITDALNRFLGTLKPEARGVFIRKYWYFDPIAEIAKKYSCSESRITSMLFRTRNKLKVFLEKEGIKI